MDSDYDMNGLRIREARRQESELIAGMWQELMRLHEKLDARFAVSDEGRNLYKRHIEEMIRSREGRVLVAEAISAGPPVGFVLLEIHARSPLAAGGAYGLISDIYVSADWRRQGAGRALIEEALHWFTERKVGSIQLYVAVANPEALAFWQSVGMRPYMHVLQSDVAKTTPVAPAAPPSDGKRNLFTLFSSREDHESEE